MAKSLIYSFSITNSTTMTQDATLSNRYNFNDWIDWIVKFLDRSGKLAVRRVCSSARNSVHDWCMHPTQTRFKMGSLRALKQFHLCRSMSDDNTHIENAFCLLMLNNGCESLELSPQVSAMLLEVAHTGGPHTLPKYITHKIHAAMETRARLKRWELERELEQELRPWKSECERTLGLAINKSIAFFEEMWSRTWRTRPFVLYQSRLAKHNTVPSLYITSFDTKDVFTDKESFYVLGLIDGGVSLTFESYGVRRLFDDPKGVRHHTIFPYHLLTPCDDVSAQIIRTAREKQVLYLIHRWGNLIEDKAILNRRYNQQMTELFDDFAMRVRKWNWAAFFPTGF